MLHNHNHQKVYFCQKVTNSRKVFVSINIPPDGNSQRGATNGTLNFNLMSRLVNTSQMSTPC